MFLQRRHFPLRFRQPYLRTCPAPRRKDVPDHLHAPRWALNGARGATIHMGSGLENHLSLREVNVGSPLTMLGDRGVDYVAMANVHISGRTSYTIGARDDLLAIFDLVFRGPVVLKIGTGDDRPYPVRVFQGLTVLSGGPGEDTLVDNKNEYLDTIAGNVER